ncbi:hypothetical protein PV05_08381 [Exophiala xenobiotica]|uniref:Nuclear envelope protein n=1 Tax=Exophiala xenobiotica TaxID=348802 RepID=A0A0D2EBL1_9EURO|nr:uncharacterized protein PV05_08381 [Exophiala xenobiotica]KIW52758.1 hypothetical protein PV05_08381 [Exophiala xenobiotica]
MSTIASSPAIPRPRPYRRSLNSTLHTRFVHAALISLLIALNNAFWLGSNRGASAQLFVRNDSLILADLFWSWFPFGPAGIKALLFFISSLSIFFLQIATLKIGRWMTTSPFAVFRTIALSKTTVWTVFWYFWSAIFFTEVYVWSSPDLSWTIPGSHNAPEMLNEKPIFFRLYAQLLALTYAGVHLYLGNSSLIIPISKLPSTPSPEGNAQSTHPIRPVQIQLQQKLPGAVMRSAVCAGLVMVAAPFLNTLFFRRTLWHIHLTIAKIWSNLSRANARPTGIPPLGPTYLARCLFAGFLLALTWELTAILFSTYLSQEPTKAGLPLSNTSKDPNGTLLTGLRAKRDVVRTFAFWELAIIAQKHKDRRKTIFEDIERPTGPIWAQMSEAGLKILQEIDTRILGPAPKQPQPQADSTVTGLPHIVPEVQTQSIFQANPKPTVGESLVLSPLRHIGSSNQPWRPPIEETTKAVEMKLLEYARPPGADQVQSQSLIEQWTMSLQKSPIGWFFTSTKTARINVAVLGSPNDDAALIVDVIDSITKMLVASLTEDTYGKATPTVPETVRQFTKTLTTIEAFVAKNDISKSGGIEEVEIITERLRAGLKELLAAFQLYLLDVGLGIADLNQAKKAVEPPKSEPQQPKPVEQPTRRQLFAKDTQKEDTNPQRAQQRQESRRIEPSQRSSGLQRKPSTSRNARQQPRREMEQVR